MMKLICKLFNHRWNYYVSSIDTPSRNFRCCPNCGKMQEYRLLPFTPADITDDSFWDKRDWVTLTERTKKGGKEFEETLALQKRPQLEYETWKKEKTYSETKSWGTVLFRIKGDVDCEGFTEEQLKRFYFQTFKNTDGKKATV